MNTDELKGYIQEYAESYLQKAGRGSYYVCPFCRSGDKKNKTPALKVYHDGYKCFSCHEYGDIFDLVCANEGLSAKDGFARVKELYNHYEPRPVEKRGRKTNVRYKYKDYIEQCSKEVSKAKDYLKKRGFSKEDAARFRLGYDAVADGIVIPYDTACSYYLRRSVKDKFFYKPPSDEAGPEPIYNASALKRDVPCFICESPIDAMSVMVASEYNAIAIGGTGVKKLVDYIDSKGVNAPLIVSLDDDEDKERNAGLECAKDLMGELAGRRIPFVFAKYSKDLYPKTRRKDANDMLTSRPEVFAQDLKENAKSAMAMKHLMECGVL